MSSLCHIPEAVVSKLTLLAEDFFKNTGSESTLNHVTSYEEKSF